MIRNCITIVAFAAVLAGCQTTAQQTTEDDPLGWFGFDCERPSLNAQTEAKFERAKLICTGRADAAAIAGTANIRPGYSMGSAIAAGIEANQKQTQISLATGTSCMAELGYQLKKRSEFEALCPLPPLSKPPGKSVMTKKPIS